MIVTAKGAVVLSAMVDGMIYNYFLLSILSFCSVSLFLGDSFAWLKYCWLKSQANIFSGLITDEWHQDSSIL